MSKQHKHVENTTNKNSKRTHKNKYKHVKATTILLHSANVTIVVTFIVTFMQWTKII